MSADEIDRIDEIGKAFRRDTAKHELTVLLDVGLYRHVRVRRPEHGIHAFDLVTQPGHLTIRGDIYPSWTFERVPDMFAFFRGRRINPDYWARKTEDGPPSCRTYDEASFRRHVTDRFVDAVRDGGTPRGLGKAVREEILNRDLSDETEARALLEEFEFGAGWRAECVCGESAEFLDGGDVGFWRSGHSRRPGSHLVTVEPVEGFRFDDAWEWDCGRYSRVFLWACHAVVHGIALYDEHVAATTAVAGESVSA